MVQMNVFLLFHEWGEDQSSYVYDEDEFFTVQFRIARVFIHSVGVVFVEPILDLNLYMYSEQDFIFRRSMEYTQFISGSGEGARATFAHYS